MVRHLLLFLLSAIVLSCNPLDQPPSGNNANKALHKFYKDSTKYNENQIELMEGLASMLEGEAEFEKDIGYKVTTESYDSVISEVVTFFENQNFTYQNLIDCEDIVEEIKKEKLKELEPIAERIDVECKRRQAEMDRIDKVLTRSMSTKLTNLQTGYSETDGSYAQFRVVDLNHTGKQISGRKVRIEFYDGFNNLVHATTLKGGSRFKKSDVSYLVYYKNQDEDSYRKFANMKLSSFRIVTESKAINIDGELIAYPSWTNVNFQHERNNPTSTYCPYLEYSDDNEPLKNAVADVESKYEALEREGCEGYVELFSTYLSKIELE